MIQQSSVFLHFGFDFLWIRVHFRSSLSIYRYGWCRSPVLFIWKMKSIKSGRANTKFFFFVKNNFLCGVTTEQQTHDVGFNQWLSLWGVFGGEDWIFCYSKSTCLLPRVYYIHVSCGRLKFPIPQCTAPAAPKTAGLEWAWTSMLYLRKQKQHVSWQMGQRGQKKKSLVDNYIFSLTLNPNLPDWAISSFITATYHQLIVSNLRHREVHEVPPSDVDFPVDVAGLSEHDLENKKQKVVTKSFSTCLL